MGGQSGAHSAADLMQAGVQDVDGVGGVRVGF